MYVNINKLIDDIYCDGILDYFKISTINKMSFHVIQIG